jgi:hypothetical protein
MMGEAVELASLVLGLNEAEFQKATIPGRPDCATLI